MEEYRFNIDEQLTIWARTRVSVKANSKEEALEKLKKAGKKCGWEMYCSENKDIECMSYQYLDDTVERVDKDGRNISVLDNDGEDFFEEDWK